MAKNENLHRAKATKEDEFYTQRSYIEEELSHYKEHFKDKVVYCNCDDPVESEFWKFFVRVFKDWGLKKLMATHYEPDEKNYAYMLEISEDTNGDGRIDINDEPTMTQIQCNGDFRSQICIDLLKQADIVVTNPPFSLWRDYVAQLMEYGKQFLIIGSQNAITYKEIFPLLMNDKMWLGYYAGDMKFKVPDYYEPRATRFWIDDNGQKWRSLGNTCWYTNLDIPKRHQHIDLRGNYFHASDYPRYDNYDAIEVNKVDNIPCDYDGVMGVPITFMNKYSPEQFEIVGTISAPSDPDTLNLGIDYSEYIGYTQDRKPNGRTGSTFGKCPVIVMDDKKHPYYEKDGIRVQTTYHRVFVRNKNPEPRRYPDED